MPSTSVRDLVVHDHDLVIATHGRSFWILDDVTPLRAARRAVASPGPFLCSPAIAMRVRDNRNTDTPMPPDEPLGENPPDGAVFDIWLPQSPQSPVMLEILDASGRLVRRFRTDDVLDSLPTTLQVPRVWMRPPQSLVARAGMNRFVWDLHGPALAGAEPSYPIAATPGRTPAEPRGPWVVPGRYRVRLTVGEVVRERGFEVRMDPRVRVTTAELTRQLQLSRRLAEALRRDSLLTANLMERINVATDRSEDDLEALSTVIRGPRAAPAPGATRPTTLEQVRQRILRLYDLVQEADAAPTPAMEAATTRVIADLTVLEQRAATLGIRVRER
jgi:hypothetical protein